MKLCKKCNIYKKLTEFFKDNSVKDGYRVWCKKCERISFRKRRLSNPEKYKAKDKRYYDNNKTKKLKYLKQYNILFPEKKQARDVVRKALKSGTITKKICHCGEEKVDAHHGNYNKPLDVSWLCKRCHRIVHGITMGL